MAVLDTGVHGDHPCISGRVREFVVIDPLGRRIEASPSFDSGQHGTHVCGTIAGGKTKNGISIGVAPQANLLVAGVLLGNATLRTLIEGMSWAIENGPTSSTCHSVSPTTNRCSSKYSTPLSTTTISCHRCDRQRQSWQQQLTRKCLQRVVGGGGTGGDAWKDRCRFL